MRILAFLCAGLFLMVGILSCDRDVAEPVTSGGSSAYPGMPPYEPVMSDEVSGGGDVKLSKLLAQARAASNHTQRHVSGETLEYHVRHGGRTLRLD